MSDLRSKYVNLQNWRQTRKTHLFGNFIFSSVKKKRVPTHFLKSFFFMSSTIGLNLLNFFNFFALKTEKFHFAPKNRARTAKLSLYTNQFSDKKYIEIYTLDVWENFFLQSCKDIHQCCL